MKLLAFDTSSNACSVALMDNARIVQKYKVIPQQHAQVIINWISELLTEVDFTLNDLDALAYSCGPGSFTGIRIGAALGQGISIAVDKPLIAVPSLQVIAQGLCRELGRSKIMVLIDARMGQVYSGYYCLGDSGIMEKIVDDRLCPIQEIDFSLINSQDWCLVTDIGEYQGLSKGLAIDSLFAQIISNYYPKAFDVLSIAAHLIKNDPLKPLDEALPIYLRTADYWKKISTE